MLEYKNALVLAPMVRVSELPMRLLSLKYGADLVWGPELIDKKIVQTKRVVNERLKTVDFCTPDSRVVFRTLPLERSRLVFQMGTADPELAVRAAKIVAGDVGAIDVNSGCPKHFSVHSGMGAALLRTPEKLEAILRALVSEVGEPNQISISVKIRILDSAEETYALVRRLVTTGISCLTVHCRTPVMRPREDPIYEYLREIAAICHGAGVPCLVNGSVQNRDQLASFIETYGVDGAMIARAAEANPSCFASGALQPLGVVVEEFLAACRAYEFPSAHAKYWLTKSVSGKDRAYQAIARSKTLDELERVVAERWGEPVREPVREPVSEPAGEAAGEVAREPAGEPVREAAGEPAAHETAGESAHETACEPAHETAGEPAVPAPAPTPDLDTPEPKRQRQV